MEKWRLVAKITTEYHKKETKQSISLLEGALEAAESGEEEIGDYKMDKRINKSTIWGLLELVGEISSGTRVLHCDCWYQDRKTLICH